MDPSYVPCKNYLIGRKHRERFPKQSKNRAKELGGMIHLDLVGPIMEDS
jgi:hypothetical protein